MRYHHTCSVFADESAGLMQFTVTGVFKESEEASTPVVRHFSRTFLVVPQVKTLYSRGSEKGSREPGALTLSWELCA